MLVYILKKEVRLTGNDFELGVARITKLIELVKCKKLKISLRELHKLCLKARVDDDLLIDSEGVDESEKVEDE
jgi:hypothetical protein